MCRFMNNVRIEENEKWQSKHVVADYRRVQLRGMFGNSVSDNEEWNNSEDLSENLWNIRQWDSNKSNSW